MSKDKEQTPVGLEIGKESTEAKPSVGFSYVGPNYDKGIFGGRQIYDLKKMTKKEAENHVKLFPSHAKYFNF